ncbi:GLI pathogenesis-related 2 [Maylandia zebra]|uniref:GLI pathogenesis-related 2 n=1 Tax=Maylandia zebra TaxID=106582 RepID=UPI00403C55DA
MADESFKKEFLDTHNAYRAQHGAPPLTFNTELDDAAQKWANQMLAKKKLGHSDTDDGENVFYAWSSETKTLTGKEAVDSWYSEIKDYDFKKSGHQPKTGHFTQVVWKSSTQLGVGIATDGNTVFVVGQYRPAGNITNAGYYQKNVLPKGTELSSTNEEDSEAGCKAANQVTDESFKKEFLHTHNAYRAQHGAPPLTFNTELDDAAQKWANQMLAKKKLGHSDTDDGENVFYAWSSETKTLTGKEAVDSWYSEIKDYDFKKSGHQPKTGHFTQVVWKSSTQLGVGIATDGNTVFVVGQYRPAGNITNAGYYQKNVLPKGTELSSTNEEDSEAGCKAANQVTDESFKKEFLHTHNAYRAQHGAPPLTFNTELDDAAQKWANQMLAKKKLGHSDTDDGENVFYAWSSETKTLTGKEAVDSWYSEIKDYDFKKSGHQPKTGHFTQVVWKSSTQLGVGIATDGNTVFVVGQYRPAGNITNAGYYQKNVLPKGTELSSTNEEDSEAGCKAANQVTDESFKKEFLHTHNAYRAQHGAPPLTFNTELDDAAQKWANQMLAKKKLGHSDTDDGENVFYAWSSETKTLTGKEAVDSWYSEIKDYDFKKSGHQPKTGHFTQVVWKSSTELGVGIATDGNTVFVVGQYRPAGNITNAGYYQKNVLPKGTE